MFPLDLSLDWPASCGSFRSLVVHPDTFVHRVPMGMLKWVACVRCGCIATRERLTQHRISSITSCPCCGAPCEGDLHVAWTCCGSLDLLREA